MGERRPLNGAKKVVLCGLMASTLTVLKMVLSPLPNIEPVSLLILVYALVFGRQVLSIILPFVVVEGLLYGFNPMWWLGYLYVWPLWGLICTKLPPGRPLLLAMASGTFGLAFGALMSVPYWITGGPWAALSWWISGIPADLLHCGGNFVLALVLADPLYQVLCKLRDKVFR